MRQWILNILSGLSLMLFAAIIMLWARTYWRGDNAGWSSCSKSGNLFHTKMVEIGSASGDCGIQAELITSSEGFEEGWFHYSYSKLRGFSLYFWAPGYLGFGWNFAWRRSHRTAPGLTFQDSVAALRAPDWFLAILFVIFPACRFGAIKRRQRRWRQEHGLCANCGYDLRATPEATGPLLPRCPECGTDTPASSPSR